jgi:putative transposase
MVSKTHKKLSVRRQCKLLGLPRASFYHKPHEENPVNLALMKIIDRICLENPTWGVEMLRMHLRNQGVLLNSKRLRRLLRKMGMMPIYQKPNLSRKNPAHKVYPYLLRNLEIDRPNHVWTVDITYVPFERGFAYLVAIMDWHSRFVLEWELSNTLDADFCVAALKRAILKYGKPDILNSDQGCQFTGKLWIEALLAAGVKISMDGRGRALDNVMIERLWRTVKYDDIYIKSYGSIPEAQAGLKEFFRRYNHVRPHSSHAGRPPAKIYFEALPCAACQ